MPIQDSGEDLRLRGNSGDGVTDINEEINGNATDTDVSLSTLNTVRFATVAEGDTVTGRSMSEMEGYSAFTSAFPSTEADGALGESLLFDDNNHQLHHTPTLSSNRKTFTWSGWFKFSNTSSNEIIFEAGDTSGNNYISLRRNTSNKFHVLEGRTGTNGYLATTNEIAIDTSSWYHCVFAVDTRGGTELTGLTKFRLYVNGIELPLIATNTTLPANQDLGINTSAFRNCIGKTARTDQYADWTQGVIADVKFIDGQQLRPDSFGELVQGIWVPKAFNKASTDTLVTSNLIANYELNGNANDTSESATTYNGTATNVTYYNNNYGIANFNGSSSVITLPNTVEDDVITNSKFTVSGWFNTTTVSSRQFIMQMYQDMYLMVTVESNGKLQGTVSNSAGTNTEVVGSTALSANTWYHFVWTGRANDLKLFLNGNLVGSSSNWNGTFFSTTNVQPRIGARGISSGPGQLYFNGRIGEVQIYSDMFTPAEVKQNYNATKHKYTYGLNGFWLPLNNTSTGSIDSSSNLKLHLDASDSSSYGGSGTTWSDLTDNDNDGTISGANFLSSTDGGVFDFDGSNDYVEFADNTDLRLLGDYTIEGWFNTDALSGDQRIVNKDDATDHSAGYTIMIHSNGQMTWSHNEGSNENWAISAGITTGKWYHFVASYSDAADKRYFYLNGKLIATRATTTNLTGENDKLFIGTYGDQSPSGQYFNGKIGQVRIYNKSLTAQEAITNYRATQGNYEQVSTVDISGNANNFTASNIDYTDHIPDEPLDNYAALNPADLTTGGTISEGGLKFTDAGSNGWNKVRTTLAATSGKWYFEMLHISATNNSQGIGIVDANAPNKGNELWGQVAGGINYYGQNGLLYENGGAAQSYSLTYGSNTRLMCAFDMDAGKIWFGRNGTWIGDPEAGTGAASTTIKNYITAATPFAATYYSGASMSFDFGQNGFTYDPPTGFKALTTSNLAAPTFDPDGATPDNPSNYFKAVTYQGNGGIQGEAYGYKEGSRAAVFNGSSSIITLPSTFSSTYEGKTNWSFSAWVYMPSSAASKYIFTKYNSNHQLGGIQIYTNSSSKLNFFVGNTSDNRRVANGSTVLSADTWHHVIVIWSSNNISMYVDGNAETISYSFSTYTGTTIPTTTTNATKPNRFGAVTFGSGTTSYSNIKIDEVRVFDKALNSTEAGYLADDDTTNIDAISKLVAYYDMEGDSDNANNSPIDSGQSAVFNGSSSHIDIPSPIPYTNTSCSFSCWFNLDTAFSSGFKTIIGAGNKSTEEGIIRVLLRYDSANNYKIEPLRAFSGNSYYTASSSYTAQTINAGTWYHLVFTYSNSGNTAKIYLNGSLVSTTSLQTPSTDLNNTGVLSLGQYRDSASAYNWDGKLDQVRIYSSVLSLSNVEALASETNVPTANLLAHYKLDGNGNDETTNYNASSVNNVTYSSAAVPSTYNGTDTNVTYTQDKPYGNIDVGFAPDLVWIKCRDAAKDHRLYDSVRGATKFLESNNSEDEGTASTSLTSFDSNGFTLGAASTTNSNGDGFVAWAWKAAGEAVSGTSTFFTNTKISANTDAGFSIVKFTIPSGSWSTDASYNHGLNSAPKLVITKAYSGAASSADWYTYHEAVGTSKYLRLNTNNDATSGAIFGTVDGTKVKYRFASSYGSSSEAIAYNFTDIDGFSKIGSYTGNGSSDGPFVYTGFKPAFVMIKRSDNTGAWIIIDGARNTKNPLNERLKANENSELSTLYDVAEFLSNGFKIADDDTEWNQNGGTYIYVAFAEDPVKYSNGVATLGDGNEFIQDANYPEDNFAATTYAGSGAARTIVTGSFKPDLVWVRNRTSGLNHTFVTDSLRGAGIGLFTGLLNGNTDESAYFTSFVNNGFTTGLAGGNTNASGSNYVAWAWKAAGHEYKSAEFNGSSSLIDTSWSPTLSNVKSVSLWFNSTMTAYGNFVAFGKTGNNSNYPWALVRLTNTGTIHAGYLGTIGGNVSAVTTTNTFNDGQWHHVVATFSGTYTSSGVVNIYVDGNDVSTTASTGADTPSTVQGIFHMGYIGSGTKQTYYNGKLDQVRIFNKVLSTDNNGINEIETLYNETKSTVNTLQVLGDSSCVATYRLNGDALDLSGNYNGTASNVDYVTGSHFTYNIHENKVRTFSHKASDLSLNTGTITPSDINANRDNGFSIVKYTGIGATATVAHGLNSNVELLIIKGLETQNDWSVLHKDGTDANFLQLNSSAAESGSGSIFGSPTARPTSSVFTIGNTGETGTNNKDYIAYCWYSVPGFSKIGSYTGTGSTGNTVITGFEPAFVMIKRTNSASDQSSQHFLLFDNKRLSSGEPAMIRISSNNSEYTGNRIEFLSDGFRLDDTDASRNGSGGQYIYMAFAHR